MLREGGGVRRRASALGGVGRAVLPFGAAQAGLALHPLSPSGPSPKLPGASSGGTLTLGSLGSACNRGKLGRQRLQRQRAPLLR